MAYLFAVFILICIAFAVALLTQKKFEITLAPVVFAVILILYLFGLFGILPIGVYSIVGLGILSLVFVVFRFIKNVQKTFSHLASTGFFAFLFFVVLIWYGTRGRLLSGWDEFSHWGLTVKNMMYFDAFGNIEQATTFFKGYPPALALFEYFFMKLAGEFYEPYLYRAMNILLFSMMMPLFCKVERKDWKKGILLCFVPLALPLICTTLGFNIFVFIFSDGFLGVLFAYLIYQCLVFYQNRDLFFYFAFGLGSLVMTLAKPSGLGFALLAFLILAALVCIENFRQRASWKKYIPLGIPVAFIAFAKISWSLQMLSVHVTEEWSNSSGGSITLSGIIDVFQKQAPAYRYQTIDVFINGLFTEHNVGPIRLSFASWMVVIGIIGFIAYKLSKDMDKKRVIKISTIGVILSFFAYMAYMLLVYMFQFKEYEAVTIASFDRYTSSFVVGMLITVVFMLLYVLLTEKRSIQPVLVTCLVIALFTPVKSIVDFCVYPQRQISNIAQSRAQTANTEYISEHLDPEKDRVFIIEQHTHGQLYWSTLYNSTPVAVSPLNTWSLGEKYDEGDEWTTNITPEEWEQMLMEDYTYVYIAAVDERFIAEYGHLFEDPDIQSRALYRIEKENGVNIVLDTLLP